MRLVFFYIILSLAPAVLMRLTIKQLYRRVEQGKAAQLSITDLMFLPIHFLPSAVFASMVNKAWATIEHPMIIVSLIVYGLLFQLALAVFAWSKGSSFTLRNNFIALFTGAFGSIYFGVILFLIAYRFSFLYEKVNLEHDISRILR
jgi:hypothetical protein